MHSPITDAAPLLASALRRSAGATGVAIEIVEQDDRPWASLTFTGARHRITLAADACPKFDAWLAAIGTAALTMRGHVAGEPDLVATHRIGTRHHATLDVVTVEDD